MPLHFVSSYFFGRTYRSALMFLISMKKFIFLGLSAIALAGCSSSISSSNQLIGSWKCTINYEDFNLRTIDNLRFSTNGSIMNRGEIHYPVQKPIFVYALQQNGRWTLQNSKVIYRVMSESLKRTHRSEIWAELQRDSELQQFEESLFSSLSDSENQKVIELSITDFNQNQMTIKHEIKGHKAYKGQCLKS